MPHVSLTGNWNCHPDLSQNPDRHGFWGALQASRGAGEPRPATFIIVPDGRRAHPGFEKSSGDGPPPRSRPVLGARQGARLAQDTIGIRLAPRPRAALPPTAGLVSMTIPEPRASKPQFGSFGETGHRCVRAVRPPPSSAKCRWGRGSCLRDGRRRASCPGCHQLRFGPPAGPAAGPLGSFGEDETGSASGGVGWAPPATRKPAEDWWVAPPLLADPSDLFGSGDGPGRDGRARARWVRSGKTNRDASFVSRKSLLFSLLR
jgi:hypothetical protein